MKAVFFDKDGTLIEDVPYNVDVEGIKLNSHVAEGLSLLAKNGFKLFVISNQPGVALKMHSPEALERVTEKMKTLFKSAGAELEKAYYCFHHQDGKDAVYSIRCGCRKPLPGLILRGLVDYDIDPAQSWVVGDTADDIEAAHRAGCRAILLGRDPKELSKKREGFRKEDFLAKNILEAAQIICDQK